MDASDIIRRRRDRLLYANYLAQQNRVNGGCANSVHLQNNGGAMDASLIPILKTGELATTPQEYEQVLQSSVCPVVEQVTPPPVVLDDYIYMVGGFTSSNITMYDSSSNPSITLSNPDTGNYARQANYLTKYDKNGIPVWSTTFGGINTLASYANGSSIIAKNGFIYVTTAIECDVGTKEIHFYSAGSNVPAIQLTLPSIHDNGYFFLVFAKYDLDGQVQLVNYCGYTQSGSFSRPIISVDSLNNIYLSSMFTGSFLIYNSSNLTTSTAISASALSEWDNIMIKYSPQGEYEWYLHFGANTANPTWGSNAAEFASSIVFDSLNNIYISITTNTDIPLQFYHSSNPSLSIFSLPQNQPNNAYNSILKITPLGSIVWGNLIRGITTGGNNTYGGGGKAILAIDSLDYLYITSMYSGGNTLRIYNYNDYNTPSITLSASLNTDIGLTRISSSGIAMWSTKIVGSANEVQPVISVNSDNNIVISGVTLSNSIFIYNESESTPIKTINMLSGGTKTFIAIYNSEGIHLSSTYIGRLFEINYSSRPDIRYGSDGSIYLISMIDALQTVNLYDKLGNVGITFINPITNLTTILVKYDNDLTPQWVAFNDSQFSNSHIYTLAS